MDGIQSQIENSNEELYNATEDDFIDLIQSLISNSKDTANNGLVFLTVVGGYLKQMFKWHGRKKLPRKMKKRVYLTKKLRKQYIPEYYKTKHI